MSTPATPRRTGRGRRVARVLLPLLALTWLVGGGALVLAAVGESLAFLGESPSAEERARSAGYLLAAAWVAAGVPVLGLVLAAVVRSRAGVVVFSVLLLLGLAFAGLVGVERYRDRSAEPRAPVTVCQERSGGDTRCPGG